MLNETAAQMSRDDRRYWTIVAIVLLVKTILAITYPISGDEAEYWDCSRHFDWSYLDHTPLLFWLMIPARAIFGETRLAVRTVSLLAGLAFAFILRPLVRRLGAEERATETWLLLNAMPLFFLGTIYCWTDVLLLLAYASATLSMIEVAQGNRRGWWYIGLSFGLGLLAKIMIGLAAPALLVMLRSPEARRDLKTPRPYLAALLSVVITIPVWYWSIVHHWENFRFQFSERHHLQEFQPRLVLEFLISNILLTTPFVAAAIVVAIIIWKGKREVTGQILLCAAAVPFFAFLYASTRERAGAHWAAATLILGAVVAGITPFRGKSVLVVCGAVTTALVTVLIGVLAVSPEVVMDKEWSYGGNPVRVSTSYLTYAVGNEAIAQEVLRRLQPGEMMASENYTNVHLFSFLTGGKLPTRLAWLKKNGKSGLPSLYWYRPEELEGHNFLFVSDKGGMDDQLREIFASISEQPPIVIKRGTKVLRTMRVVRCVDLRKPDGVFTLLPRG
ncbi:MAG TPA: glycosyltransferase family 39 protein [Thermoanaerobaculia bacterium]|nr:glycosyltransferase family 39 protein [Thermoanaerobaculia bacterium]